MNLRPTIAFLSIAVAAAAIAGCARPAEFTATLTDTRSTVQATLTDVTGTVTAIEFVRPLPAWALRAPDGSAANSDDDAVQVTWTGGNCPSRVALSTSAAPAGEVLVEIKPETTCQEDAGKTRVLEIRFDHPVRADTVKVSLSPGPTLGP